MFPLLTPPLLSTAIDGLSLRTVELPTVLTPDEPAEALAGPPNVWQSSVERATPIAGLPPIVAFSP